jgi:hypothetical protein
MSRLQKLIYICIADNTSVITHYTNLGGLFQLDRDLNMDLLDRVRLIDDLEVMCDIELQGEYSWVTVNDVVNSVIQAGGDL